MSDNAFEYFRVLATADLSKEDALWVATVKHQWKTEGRRLTWPQIERLQKLAGEHEGDAGRRAQIPRHD